MSTVLNTSAVGPAFLRTQRHGPSGVLSLVSGGLVFAAFNIDGSIRIPLFGASTLAPAAMFATLFWPKRGVRSRPSGQPASCPDCSKGSRDEVNKRPKLGGRQAALSDRNWVLGVRVEAAACAHLRTPDAGSETKSLPSIERIECFARGAAARGIMMQVVRGNVEGPMTVGADTLLRGNVMGDVIVRPGCRLELRGNVMGDIVLEGNASARIKGNLMGDVVQAR